MRNNCYIVTYDVNDGDLREEITSIILQVNSTELSPTTYLICCTNEYINKGSV